MTIEDSVDVDAPLHRTWPLLSDIPRVVSCIPNAEITDTLDDRTYRARVSVQVGPIALRYRATIVVESIDEPTHSATFQIEGDDIEGRGGVRATVVTRARPKGHRTHISMRAEAQVGGIVATLGGRFIEGVAKRIVAQFAQNLADRANAVCAILAAGHSSRIGSPKSLLEFRGKTLLERALEAARGRRAAVVLPQALAPVVPARENLLVVINDEPERGMTHSLALANAALAEHDAALIVLLVDTPLVDAPLVERLVAARRDADVAYPIRGGVPGHPVVFGPRPRAHIGALPDGDTLRTLRADPRWRRVECRIDEDGPFTDIDTPEDLERIATTEGGNGRRRFSE